MKYLKDKKVIAALVVAAVAFANAVGKPVPEWVPTLVTAVLMGGQ